MAPYLQLPAYKPTARRPGIDPNFTGPYGRLGASLDEEEEEEEEEEKKAIPANRLSAMLILQGLDVQIYIAISNTPEARAAIVTKCGQSIPKQSSWTSAVLLLAMGVMPGIVGWRATA